MLSLRLEVSSTFSVYVCLLQSHATPHVEKNVFLSLQEIERGLGVHLVDDLHRAHICLNQAWTNSGSVNPAAQKMDLSVRLSKGGVAHTEKHNPLRIGGQLPAALNCKSP